MTTTEIALDQLAEHEAVIERGMATFVEVGNALLAIRDARLYRATGYSSFEAYCKDRWGMSRFRAYQLIDASEISELLTNVNSPPLTNESQARELAPLKREPEALQEVWEEAVERNGGKPSGREVREVREEVKFSQIAPPKNDKSRAAVASRNERIVAMARDGYQTAAISAAVGQDEETINRKIREAGLQTVRDRIGATKRVDVNRVMESVVDAAMPSEHAIAVINADWKDLDRERFPEWRSSLRQTVNVLRRLVEKIEKETK